MKIQTAILLSVGIKVIVVSMFLCGSFYCVGQTIMDSLPLESSTGKIKYEQVIEIPGTKDGLFTKTKLWLVDMFENSKDVIQHEDKAEGVITGQGYFLYKYYFSYAKKKAIITEKNIAVERASFAFKVFLKDGKAKLLVSDIVLLDPGKLSFLDISLDNVHMDLTKQLLNGKLDEQAKGATNLSKFRGVDEEIKDLFTSLKNKLSQKAENDF